MGVKRALSLQKLQELFPSYSFDILSPTTSGVVDTTYISEQYIIKFYERDIQEKIALDADILLHLHSAALNVPRLLEVSDGWHLYERLKGDSPQTIKLFHIQTLARFMAQFHAQKIKHPDDFLKKYEIQKTLSKIKKYYFRFYKELEPLKEYTMQNDGFIHGDIFIDNTLFNDKKIAVFDFIDGGSGAYIFDIAVALLSFNPNNRPLYTKVFLNTYNQQRAKKIALDELKKTIKIASLFYGILRIETQKGTSRAKKLIFR